MALNVNGNGMQEMKFEIDQCYANDVDGQIIRMKKSVWVDTMLHEMNGYDGCHQSTGSSGTVIDVDIMDIEGYGRTTNGHKHTRQKGHRLKSTHIFFYYFCSIFLRWQRLKFKIVLFLAELDK